MVSVIIPSYKPQEYILECFRSLYNQVLCSDEFEVIVVLNGPKENYLDYINLHIRNYSNFSCHYLPIGNVSLARNFGVSMAKGDFICFIDDDDFVSPNYISGLLNENNSDINVIVQSNFKNFKDGYFKEDYISLAYCELKDSEFSLLSYRKFLSSVCGKLYSRELLVKVKFNEVLKTSEDALFLFELSMFLKGIKIVNNEEVIYYRRVREGSAVTKDRTFMHILDIYIIKNKMFFKAYFKNVGMYNLPFFITRILAINKVLVNDILKKIRK